MASCAFCQLTLQRPTNQLTSYSDRILCRFCKQSIHRNQHACIKCAEPQLNTANTPSTCASCISKPPPWDEILCPLLYTHPVQPSLKAFKFHRKTQLGRALLACFLDTLGSHYAHRPYPTRIMTVPMHSRRFRSRGFDANAWLIKALSRKIPIPVDNNSLIKSKATQPQNSLTRANRLTNLQGSFSLAHRRDDLRGEHIALFDDVMTTGSTLTEIARLLKTQRPASIHIWCLARTPGRHL